MFCVVLWGEGNSRSGDKGQNTSSWIGLKQIGAQDNLGSRFSDSGTPFSDLVSRVLDLGSPASTLGPRFSDLEIIGSRHAWMQRWTGSLKISWAGTLVIWRALQ